MVHDAPRQDGNGDIFCNLLFLFTVFVVLFLEFDQCTEKIFGMDKRNTLAMHIVLRFAVAQHLRAFGGEISTLGINVAHAHAKVMHAAFGIAFEKLRHG